MSDSSVAFGGLCEGYVESSFDADDACLGVRRTSIGGGVDIITWYGYGGRGVFDASDMCTITRKRLYLHLAHVYRSLLYKTTG